MDYLLNQGAPESRWASEIPGGPWHTAVVVPCLREGDGLPSLIASLRIAAQRPTLVILVVNRRKEAPPEDEALNRASVRPWVSLGEHPWARVELKPLTLLILDRNSPGRELASDEGVGTARKIGADVGLALWKQGRLTDPWARTTDGDATVEPHYLDPPQGPRLGGVGSEPAGAVHRFRHGNGGPLPPSLCLYEIFLRHYRLGLAWARSPYAFHTIGSTLAFTWPAYEGVRGFPRRQAAEDFYFLDKLARWGAIQDHGSTLHLTPRPSDRVPFGTGAAMARIDSTLKGGRVFTLHPPQAFRALRTLLQTVESSERTSDLRGSLQRALPPHLFHPLEGLGFWRQVESARETRRTDADFRRHLRTSFGSLKTFQWIRQAGAVGDFRANLKDSPFLPPADYDRDAPETILERMREWDEKTFSP